MTLRRIAPFNAADAKDKGISVCGLTRLTSFGSMAFYLEAGTPPHTVFRYMIFNIKKSLKLRFNIITDPKSEQTLKHYTVCHSYGIVIYFIGLVFTCSR